ncbi:MAG: VOC family protein [Candidatus Latescibacterota bacterium]|nr:MAG: VOC family protein [Candidatus Latescibacterota bacterium]
MSMTSNSTQLRIESLSAVTLVTGDMQRAVAFYTHLGFEKRHGGAEARLTSFDLGGVYLNLIAHAGPPPRFWGRIILHVSDVDAMYRRALELGLTPEAAPRDAEWGERYFHLVDPDGHELSFASPLDTQAEQIPATS